MSRYAVYKLFDGCNAPENITSCGYLAGVFVGESDDNMAFVMDLRNWKVISWNKEGVWYEDATGGKAMRELGYEPIEDYDGNE